MLLVVVVVTVLAGLPAVWLVIDALDARQSLRAAQQHLRDAVIAIGDGDDGAEELAAARRSVRAARSSTSGPHWWLGSRVPVAGRAPRILGDVVEVAGGAVDVAAAARSLLESDLEVTDGAIDLGTVRLIHNGVRALPVEELSRATEQLRGAATTFVPEVVREGRRETLTLATQTLEGVARADAGLGMLPAFLGGDGERRYLLAIQNPAEVRGTGGLLGFISVLTASEGRLSVSSGVVTDQLDQGEAPLVADVGGDVDQPVAVGDDFEDRYGHTRAASFVAHSNLEPDLPTTAPNVMAIYEQRTGAQLDGLVLVDPVGLASLLSTVGPVELPAAVVDDAGRLPTRVAPDDVVELTTVELYEVFGDEKHEQRTAYATALAEAAFAEVFSGSWDVRPMVGALGDAAAGRHLQLYSRHQQEQQAFELLGVAGALAADPGADLLAATANNAVGGKQDVHVGHRVTGAFALGEVLDVEGKLVASREGTVTVELHNPLPASGKDVYIIGNCNGEPGEWGCFDGPPGVNRTWFTVWTDDDTIATAVTDAEGRPRRFTAGTIHGHMGTDVFLDTPPRSENSFTVELEGMAPLRRDGPDLVYELTYWKQAEATPDRLELEVGAPAGWDVAEVTVEGGGDGNGMGPYGEPGPRVSAIIERSRVAVSGDVTADMHLTVRYTRGLWDRLTDWFGDPLR